MRKPKDWGHPCPNPACTHYRRMQQGNVSAIATYLTQSGKRRIFRCHTCELPFSETRETVFFDLRTSEEKVMMALKMLLVRVDLAGIGFVLGVTEATVLAWLKRAAHQAEAINHHLLQNLPVTQTTITWTRGGSSPQFMRVTFESSTDNVNYTPLGNGTATGSNWTLTGLNLPTGQNFYIRARGYYRSGDTNGSESLTESVRNAFLAGPPPTPTPAPDPNVGGNN